jgi:protein-L-isoaspartate(D-aspartate) O-methyltransferase
MIDFERMRQSMVDSQLRPNDVTDPRILSAMLEVPRERFVPASRVNLAYLDDDLPVREAGPDGPARYLMEPMILARLVQALDVQASSHVLDVGCATGYSTAILAKLASSVIALEADADLVAAARRNLAGQDGGTVQVVHGGLAAGAAEAGPYDAVLLNGAVEVMPEALLAQLKEGGRLVAVIRSGPLGRANIFVKSGGAVSSRPLFDAAVPLLPGFEASRGFVF